MIYLTYLSLAIAPVLIITIYIYVRDKFNREPFWLLTLSLVGGMFSVIPVLITGMFSDFPVPYLNGIQIPFYEAFFQAGFVEEMFKYLVVLLLVWRSRHFDERFDGIVYAVFVSMGFALVENIMYVFDGGIGTGLIRIVTAVPAHAIFGISMGYYLGMAKFNPWRRSSYLALAFVVPWLLHGFYDFAIMAGYNWLLLVFIIYLIFMYIYGFRRIRELARYKVKPVKETESDKTENINFTETENTKEYGTEEQS